MRSESNVELAHMNMKYLSLQLLMSYFCCKLDLTALLLPITFQVLCTYTILTSIKLPTFQLAITV